MTRWSVPFLTGLVLGLPAVSAAQASPAVAYYDSVEAAQPKFDDFPARAWEGEPARVDLATPKWARTFRTVLREGAKGGPNFAGHYTIVHWGCGSSCQIQAILDTRTGKVFPQRLQTMMGASYHLDSSLLLADPISAVREAFDDDTAVFRCAACGTPAAYQWTGTRFVPVGPGEHPHFLPD